jgi:hypothetical protein
VGNINEAASSGTTIHDFHYWARKEGVESAWKKVGEVSEELTKKLKQFELQLPKIPLPANYIGELALAYDIERDTARIIGENVARAYGNIGPTEIALSLDITGTGSDMDEQPCSVILDLKTGFTAVTPPANNWQLRVGALALTRVQGTHMARVGITKTSGVVPWTDWATFDAMDLDGFAAELKLAYKKWQGEPKFVTGSHCAWCPAISSCPAQTGLIKSVLNKGSAANFDKEDWTSAYETLKSLKAAVKHLEDSIKFKASQEPIVLKNGLVYGTSPSGTMKEFKK